MQLFLGDLTKFMKLQKNKIDLTWDWTDYPHLPVCFRSLIVSEIVCKRVFNFFKQFTFESCLIIIAVTVVFFCDVLQDGKVFGALQ